MGYQEENNLQPLRNTGKEERKFSWNKWYHTKHCIFLWVAWLRTWYYSCSTHAYQFQETALTGVYTANQQHISIQASQWLCKETQQHTQVSVGLFARRFEMVPLWAHRNVSARTVKHQKALISSCFPFIQSKALSGVSAALKVSYLVLPWSGEVCMVLEYISFLKRQEHFSKVWRVSKATSFPPHLHCR